MPTIEELIDEITQALDNIEDLSNQENVKPEDYDTNIAVIDQKWPMLRQVLMGPKTAEGE